VKPAIFLPPAADELVAAAVYYESQADGLGARFFTAMKRLTAEIEIAPHVPRVWRHGVRRHFGPEFPYMLIYIERPAHVVVIAVAHFKRRPDFWHARTA
jgi:toxin ParE1/3/4